MESICGDFGIGRKAMNDLLDTLSSSSSRKKRQKRPDDEEEGDPSLSNPLLRPAHDEALLAFLQEAQLVRSEIDSLAALLTGLQDASSLSPDSVAQTDFDARLVLTKAAAVKSRLRHLDTLQFRPESPLLDLEKVRRSVTGGLRQKLRAIMTEFEKLRGKIRQDQRQDLACRYQALTGQAPDEDAIEQLLESGDQEFLRKLVQTQGNQQVNKAIKEMEKRYDAVKGLEKDLLELHQVFLDMSVLIDLQGEELNDIEKAMLQSLSFIGGGADELTGAQEQRTNSIIWILVSVGVALIIIGVAAFLLVYFLFLKGSNGSA